MGESPHGILIARLRDAYMMEIEGRTLFDEHLAKLGALAEWRDRLEQHALTSGRHRAMVGECLVSLDGEPPATMNDAAITTDMHKVLRPFSGDDVLQQALRGYTFEVFEAGSYRLLVALATRLDQAGTARACAEMLKEEEEMGTWFWAQLPQLTVQFLTKESLRSVINHPAPEPGMLPADGLASASAQAGVATRRRPASS